MKAADLLAPTLHAPSLLGERTGEVAPERIPARPIPLPDLGVCRHRPVLLILLFDNSPSVTGDNDPVGNRFEEAALALNHYSQRCQCRSQLVAVRTFDRRTSSEVGPLRLQGTGLRTITAALATPPEVARGTSRLAPSLAAAERLAQAHAHHEAVLVVFSDFQLLDPDASAVLHRLIRFPGHVHAVVLSQETPAPLVGTRVVVSHVDHGSPRGDVARAVLGALE